MDSIRKTLFFAFTFFLGVSTAIAVSSVFYPLTFTKISPQTGQYIFNTNCSGCHNSVQSGASKIGPNLYEIGSVAGIRNSDLNAAEYLLQSLVQPDVYRPDGWESKMPSDTIAGLSASDIRDLISYLAGLGAVPDIQSVIDLDLESVASNRTVVTIPDTAVLQKGWKLFSKELGCSGCHSIYNEPGSGFLAPPLHKVSRLSREYLIESLRDPDAVIASGYQLMTAKTAAGESVRGRIISDDAKQYTLMMRDKHSHFVTRQFSKDSLSEVNLISQSIMPVFDLPLEDEFALISFLKFLRGKVGS